MIIQKYLVINHRGNVRITERQPSMGGNEIALRIEMEIPNKLFERPIIVAQMKVPDEAVPRVKITPTITDNLAKIIKENIGLNMVVTVVEQPEEKVKKS